METLKEKIQKDFIAAFKMGAEGRLKKDLLGVIKSAITAEEQKPNAKAVGDVEVMAILKSIRKGIKEVVDLSSTPESIAELAIVDSYLPQQMSEEEIRTAVGQVISEIGATSPAEMGKVMGGFNSKFAGKADGKIVSNIVKELLSVKV